MKIISDKYLVVLLISMYLTGLLGFIFLPNLFVPLTAFNLILSTFLVLQRPFSKNEVDLKNLFYIAIIGIILEVIGVKTGLIFGEYHYGDAFGFKLFDVPILIGLNWTILIVCANAIIKTAINNQIVQSLLVAGILTFMDLFIEQIAGKYDFWYWKNNVIPMRNYIAWFIIAFFLNFVFGNKINMKNKIIPVTYLLAQLLFFISLNIHLQLN